MGGKSAFLARTLQPEITQKQLREYDTFVRAAVERRLELPLESSFAASMFTLPMRLGGAGFHEHGAPENVAAAYVTSMAVTVRHLNKTPLAQTATAVLASFPALMSLSIALNVLHSKYEGELAPENLVKFFAMFKKPRKPGAKTRGLQGGIMRKLQDAGVDEKAILKSRTGSHASAWMRAFPLSKEDSLSDDAVRFGLSHLTNQKFPNLPERCYCGATLTVEHQVACKGDQLLRHNMMMAKLIVLSNRAGVPSQQVPRYTLEDCKKYQIPDATFFMGRKAVEVDMSVISSVCPTNVQAASREVGAALLKRQEEKLKKYQQEAELRGHDFKPLVFETHGRPGADVRKLLRDIVQSSGHDGVGVAVSDCMTQLLLQLFKRKRANGRDSHQKGAQKASTGSRSLNFSALPGE